MLLWCRAALEVRQHRQMIRRFSNETGVRHMNGGYV
jgi:hypothetical protein